MEWLVGGLITWAVFTPPLIAYLIYEGKVERIEAEREAERKQRKQVKTVQTGGISQNRKVGAA